VLSLIEVGLEWAKHTIGRMPWVGHVWTLAWLVLLFHRPFLAGVL
jgi:hypothetical protein